MHIVVDQCRKIDGLGRLSSPLAVVKIGDQTRLVVTPLGAIGTDAIGLALAGTLFFTARTTLPKIVAALGGLWMITAIAVEVRKLLLGDVQRLAVVKE